MTSNEKLKKFLQLKLEECQKLIARRRRRNRLIRIIYSISIGTAIVASSVVAVLPSVTVPPLAITCVSSIATLSSALSIKFNLKDRKNKLQKSIRELHKIKDKLDYVISCNGDLTEEKCNEILAEFRVL